MLTLAQQRHLKQKEGMLKRAHNFHISAVEGCKHCEEQYRDVREEGPSLCVNCNKEENGYGYVYGSDRDRCYTCYEKMLSDFYSFCESMEKHAIEANNVELKSGAERVKDHIGEQLRYLDY